MLSSNYREKIGNLILKFILMPLAGVSTTLSVTLWICYIALSDPSVDMLNAASAFTIIAGILWTGIFIRKCFPDRIVWHKKDNEDRDDEERTRLLVEEKKTLKPQYPLSCSEELPILSKDLAQIEHSALQLAENEVRQDRESLIRLYKELESKLANRQNIIVKQFDCSELLGALKMLSNQGGQRREIILMILKNIVNHVKWIDAAFQNNYITKKTNDECLYDLCNEIGKSIWYEGCLSDDPWWNDPLFHLSLKVKDILVVVESMKKGSGTKESQTHFLKQLDDIMTEMESKVKGKERDVLIPISDADLVADDSNSPLSEILRV